MGYKVAVVGATGNVGREILNTLAERNFPIDEIYAMASNASIGIEVPYGDNKDLKVSALENFDFSKVDFVISSISSGETKKYAPKATAQGAIIIDNSSAYRFDSKVPLVVPEVNGDEISNYRNKNIIASPNCVATPLCMVLRPLSNISPIKRVVVSTYQSTSGAGRKAMDELFAQTKQILMNQAVVKEEFPKQIAFNVIPQIGNFEGDGYTGEESKIINEVEKIMGDKIAVTATSVRVPSFVGHAISANIEFTSQIDEDQAREALREFDGIAIIDNRAEETYITPTECVGEDSVFVSRIRNDPSVQFGLNLWIVSDNLRKGAALNTVQIAERLVAEYF